jgi:Neuraminidase (sialidase)
VLHGFLTQMSDGSIVGMRGNIVNHLLRKDQKQVPYITTLRRFKSLEDLLAGKYEDDFPRIDVPDLAFQKGDSDHLYTGNIEARPTELQNGDWIIAMSGRFKQDNLRIPYHKWETYQFRNWVCISKDKGRSWSYLATIGDPEKNVLPKMAEGYNETDLLKLKGNTILAVMRTGGNPNPEGTLERYTYLASSLSHDGGKTWETPKPIAPYGVFPRLLALKDGTIACSSGRPGVFLIFSRDGGKTWTEPQWVTKYHAKWSECATGYSSISETEPGVLTIIYDDVERDQDGKVLRHIVKMGRYKVQ